MQRRTDNELLAEYAETGSEAAFGALASRHGPMVFRLCRSLVGDAAEAEDCAQAVFLVLVRKARSLSKRGNVGAWLCTVARHVSYRAVEARTNRAKREERAMTESRVEREPEAEDRRQLLQSVYEALDRLSSAQRQAVVLRHLEGNSPEEAAGIAGCSVAALRRRTSDGILRLRCRLARRGTVLGAGALVAAMESEASVAVPETLVAELASAGAGLEAGTASASSVAMLANSTTRALLVAKVKSIVAVAVGVVCVQVALVGVYAMAIRVDAGTAQATEGEQTEPTDAGGAPTEEADVASPYLSPADLHPGPSGALLYVVQHTGRSIAVVDLKLARTVKTIAVPMRPSGIDVGTDGSRLYVSGGGADGKLLVIDAAEGTIERTVDIGHTPMSPILTPDGRSILVCRRFNNDVVVIDSSTLSRTARIPVVREPVAAAITSDGRYLAVANHLPIGPSNEGTVNADISIIDIAAMKVATNVPLPNGATNLRDVCISPDDKYAYVSHVLANFMLPTTQINGGWIVTNGLSIVDMESRKRVATVLLDSDGLGFANPWAIACTPDNEYVCVTSAGCHSVSFINRKAMFEKIDSLKRARNTRNALLVHDLSFLKGISKRLPFAEGNGPRSLVCVDGKAIAGCYFTDSLVMLDVAPERDRGESAMALGDRVKPAAARYGETLFNDATLCHQKWLTCATCHPGARADGMNWDLLSDGIGNPKNTRSLVLAHHTPPMMSLGVHDDAVVAVHARIKFALYSNRPEEDEFALGEYIKSIRPDSSPYLEKGKLPKLAERGKRIFNEANCQSCHPGPLFTDLKRHDVGTGRGIDKNKRFDTPSLLEAWRTAPYLHDGRALTIEDVFTKFNADDRHGKTSGLSDDDIRALAEYVRSMELAGRLPPTPSRPPVLRERPREVF
ncbi:MAG: sigma-70 family RNA polymerase sigma factor [Planctomycetota bacterium]|jgi:RNA polymerase sigma factor (sigma-70 family)